MTFLFTDIEGSTQLLHALGEAYPAVLARHHEIVRDAIETYEGHVMGTEGDAFAVAFHRPEDAVRAALDAQRGLAAEAWSAAAAVRVRMGIHTGPVVRNETGYVGMALHETARISSCAHGGQVVVSAETERRALDGAVGVGLISLGRHRLKDLPAPVEIFQLTHADLPCDFPALRSLPAAATNLPKPRTDLVGREAELEKLRMALGASRMVTLAGPGGAGKTRLAIAVAATALTKPLDGVWFVDLAEATDMQSVLDAWAHALDLKPERDARETIESFLAEQSALVVIDNCEQVVDEATAVADSVLGAAARVRLLATSREALRLPGESVVTVGPLTAGEAQALFLERAAEARPGYVAEGEELAAVDTLCEALDRLPLAIELAAARVGALGAREIVGLLDERFRLLSSGRRGGVERHRTLEAAIGWSHSLLSPQTQAVFRRIAMLPRGFDADEVAAVAGEELSRFDVTDAITELVDKSLVVIEQTDIGARYSMLQSVQTFAAERLQEAGEGEIAGTCLVRWVRQLASDFAVGFQGPEWREQLAHVRRHARAVRTTISWAVEHGRTEDAAVVVGDLAYFWTLDSDYIDAWRVCAEVAEAIGDQPGRPAVYGRALVALSRLQFAMGLDQTQLGRQYNERADAAALEWRGKGDDLLDCAAITTGLVSATSPSDLPGATQAARSLAAPFSQAYALSRIALWCARNAPDRAGETFEEVAQRAESLDHDYLRYLSAAGADRLSGPAYLAEAERSLELARRLDAPLQIDGSTTNLARALIETGEFAAALPYLIDTEAFCRRHGDLIGLADALMLRALQEQWTGRLDSALQTAAEALDVAERAEDRRTAAVVLGNRAEGKILLGDYDGAERDFARSAELRRGTPDEWATKEPLALLAIERGEPEQARFWILSALDDAEAHSQRERVARDVLAGFGIVAARSTLPDFARAATLFGAAGATAPGAFALKTLLREALAAAEAALGREAFDNALAAGAALTVDEAIEFARAGA